MRIALVGFGLIGGSIARALRRPFAGAEAGSNGPVILSIVAWSPTGTGVSRALADGVVDAAPASLVEVLDGADLVVLAAPPLGCLELLDALGGALRLHLTRGATVTDVASTKATIVARADALRLPFVGGHPMAGRETSGYGAATPDLFDGRPWVVVPGVGARPPDVERVEWLARACGARPVRLDAGEHDAAVAAVSHLPLVVATALAEAVVGPADGPVRADWWTGRLLAASGWRDMTRLARGDPAMAAGILATNAPSIAARLEDLRTVLDSWLAALGAEGGPDAAALEARVRALRARLEAGPDGA